MRAHFAALTALLLAYVELVVGIVVEVAAYVVFTAQGTTGWHAVVPAFALGAAGIYLADTLTWPGRRPLTHVCRELADRVADWGGLPYEDDDQPTTHTYLP